MNSNKKNLADELPPVKRCKVNRSFKDEYLKFGFICWSGSDSYTPRPQCIICREVLSNECLKPNKLKRHLETRHFDFRNKPLEFFERKAVQLKTEVSTLKKFISMDQSLVKASYLVAMQIAKCKQSYNIAEKLIKPCLIDVCNEVLGKDAGEKMKSLPLSNDTIQRRICDLATDIEDQLIQKVSKSRFAIQIDESIDITNKAILLCYIRYADFDLKDIKEEFFCSVELKNHTTSLDIFTAIDQYMDKNFLNWQNCVGLCTDGAASMTGKHSGVSTQIKKVSHSKMIFTHCLLHREHLASKKLSLDLNIVLTDCVKIINYVKSNSLNSRLFSSLCNAMESGHENLLLHAEIRWLSRGKSLARLFELRKEVRIFLEEKHSNLSIIFNNDTWISKLAYLSDIFSLINQLNLSLQGNHITTFNFWDKIEAFKKKLRLWYTMVNEECYDMFHFFSQFLQEVHINECDLKNIIVEHLTGLIAAFDKYFPEEEDTRQGNMWILNPFIEQDTNLSGLEKEKLIDLSCDSVTKLVFQTKSVTQFWVTIKDEYPELYENALRILLPFASTYLCESAFSAMACIKTKERNRLDLNPALRLALTNITPRMDKLLNEMTQ